MADGRFNLELFKLGSKHLTQSSFSARVIRELTSGIISIKYNIIIFLECGVQQEKRIEPGRYPAGGHVEISDYAFSWPPAGKRVESAFDKDGGHLIAPPGGHVSVLWRCMSCSLVSLHVVPDIVLSNNNAILTYPLAEPSHSFPKEAGVTLSQGTDQGERHLIPGPKKAKLAQLGLFHVSKVEDTRNRKPNGWALGQPWGRDYSAFLG
ncbi:hypothetical protein B0H19DRAFT_1066492 [Mycena capillaripes]|nr:hypothetical protein B0H19DRAFT_1066492 [Mycena capillaripes]